MDRERSARCQREAINARLAHGALAVSVALFGLGWPFTKVLLGKIAPLPLIAVEVYASAICALGVALATRRGWPPRGPFVVNAGLGILSPGINYALAIGGLRWTSASAASLVSAVEPFAIVVLSVVLLRERIDLRGSVPILCAAVGTLLVANPFGADRMASLGTVAVAAGVIVGALFLVLQHRVLNVDALAGIAVQMTAGAVTLALCALTVHGPDAFAEFAALPLRWKIAIAGAGPLLDYLPFLLLAVSARTVSGAASGMAFALMPLWGIAASFVALNERLSFVQIAGGAAIVAAVAMFFRRKSSITENAPG